MQDRRRLAGHHGGEARIAPTSCAGSTRVNELEAIVTAVPGPRSRALAAELARYEAPASRTSPATTRCSGIRASGAFGRRRRRQSLSRSDLGVRRRGDRPHQPARRRGDRRSEPRISSTGWATSTRPKCARGCSRRWRARTRRAEQTYRRDVGRGSGRVRAQDGAARVGQAARRSRITAPITACRSARSRSAGSTSSARRSRRSSRARDVPAVSPARDTVCDRPSPSLRRRAWRAIRRSAR
jgi:hypothetical protein